ncbi:MAG: DEAD/DEAH box helicase [Flavobacteriaceae bacterium]|nr:MAG: DEAD/DEAH box helicase [Flavobacteriaceae bacterium]
MAAFSDFKLSKSLLKALKELELETPTSIQEKAIPVGLSGADLVGIAQTGTGKTLAYLLPCLSHWKFDPKHPIQIVIIVPTRELVEQICIEVQKITTWMNVEIRGVYGGVNIKNQQEILSGGCDVLVATPGRFIDLALGGFLKLKSVKKLVIDEADELLNLGFKVQLESLFIMLPEKRQNLLFSATMTPEVDALIDHFFYSPQRVEASEAGKRLPNIAQSVYFIDHFLNKRSLLIHLLETDKSLTKVLIFVRTKKMADFLFQSVHTEFPDILSVIHSNKAQNYRFNTVNDFKEGKIKFLIATDIIARGLDVSGVSHVINFDLTNDPENYIHRIGRTGRAFASGIAWSFCSEKEKEELKAIEELLEYTLPELPLPEDLELTDRILEHEMDKVFLEEDDDLPLNSGPGFHPKKEKNLKTNQSKTRSMRMKEKYAKPKSRGSKKK